MDALSRPAGISVWMVLTDEVASVWPEFSPWLALACDGTSGRWTTQRALAACLSGDNQLLAVTRDGEPVAAVTTCIQPAANGDWLTIILCGGKDMVDWLTPALDALAAWARQCGCVGMQINGRAGWAKAAGFTPVSVMMEKVL